MSVVGAGRAPNSLSRRLGPAGLSAYYAVLFVVSCIPIFSVADLPLGDVPNHMARIYILNNLAADPFLQKYYAVHWDFLSFQSTDLLLPPLARWFGLGAAVQIFVATTFALLIAGTAAVHRALFGRIGLWPAAAFLFLYNIPLIFGQISFLFSTGLSLLLFAAWIATERWPWVLRIPVFTAASFGLMLCHFFAFSAYGLLIMSFVLVRARHAPTWGEKLGRLAKAGLPFVPSAICFLLSFGQAVNGPTSYGKLLDKSIGVLIGTLNYGLWPDIVLSLAVIAVIWWINRRRQIVLAPDLRFATFVLLLTAIAMPSVLQGVFAADLRLPCLIYFLLVAASEVRLEGRWHMVAFMTGIFALLLLRVVTTIEIWSHVEADYREFRIADRQLERGSRAIMITVDDDGRAYKQPQTPYWFVGAFAVIDRQIYLPEIFTAATPLELTPAAKDSYSGTLARNRTVHWHPASPAFVEVDPATVRQVERVGQYISDRDFHTSTIDWSDWPERFDYIIDFDMGRPRNPVPVLLTEVQRGSYFTIYRIHPPAQPR